MQELKVAVTAWKFGTGGVAADLAEQGHIAEQIGFDSFWLPESHFAGEQSIPQPLLLLAAVARRTNMRMQRRIWFTREPTTRGRVRPTNRHRVDQQGERCGTISGW